MKKVAATPTGGFLEKHPASAGSAPKILTTTMLCSMLLGSAPYALATAPVTSGTAPPPTVGSSTVATAPLAVPAETVPPATPAPTPIASPAAPVTAAPLSLPETTVAPTTAPAPVAVPPTSSLAPDTLPTGGTISAGSGSISSSGSAMTINQQSQQMVANWNTFNIGQNASVQFQQPNSSAAALNRIHDQNPSQIFGSLSANGQIYLVNSSGIIFGETAQVNVGGLIATTLDISDDSFMQGASSFASPEDQRKPPEQKEENSLAEKPSTATQAPVPSPSPATVSQTTNSTSSESTATTTTASPPPPPTETVASSKVTNQGTIQTAEKGYVAFLAPQVENQGSVEAKSGSVVLAAGEKVNLTFAGDKLVSYNVDKGAIDALAANRGLIKADGGMVVMTAKAATSLTQAVVNNSSLIEAKTLENKGGKIVLAAEGGMTHISGTLDASSDNAAGGRIVVTGDQVHVGANALLTASGGSGGGEILVGGSRQGKDAALHHAQTTVVEKGARLTADAVDHGPGGEVVVWADGDTNFAGQISARGGFQGGDGGSAEVSGKNHLSYAGLVDLTAPHGKTGDLLLDPTNFIIGTDISGAALGAQLGLTNVIVQSGSDGGDAGNILVNEAITWGSNTTLFMKAHNDILINEIITNSGAGQLLLRSDSDGSGAGTVTFTGPGQVVFTAGGLASLYYNPAGGYAAPTNYTPEFTLGGGATLTPFMLVNTVTDLQNINNNLTATGIYALGKDIDASATTGWNGGKGFEPLGDWDHGFGGVFDGLGHTITGLYINRSTETQVGLFGVTGNQNYLGPGVVWPSTIRNIGLVNVNITGDWRVGGLVGHNVNGSIDRTYVTGSVSANTAATGWTTGGLIGLNDGPISNSYSKATVNGSNFIGGLVGANYNTVPGTITNSYSSGPVVAGGGGLSGWNGSTITGSYWDTEASGRASSFGGTGKTTAQMKQQATFAGWDFTNTWGIVENTSYPYLRSPSLGMSGTTVTLTSNAPTAPSEPQPTGLEEPQASAPLNTEDRTTPENTDNTRQTPAATISIAISSTPDTSLIDNITDQISAMPKPAPWRDTISPFGSPWNINVPYYSSYDEYMRAHPPLVISYTEQAKNYASWSDYLREHPWYVTALAMNRSPQIDAEGRFIDGLVGPLDYLTTVGSGGIGFVGLQQGGSYKGFSQTGGSYLTEQARRESELDRLRLTLSQERAYDPEVAKMWEDAATNKAKQLERWNAILEDLTGVELENTLRNLIAPNESVSLADNTNPDSKQYGPTDWQYYYTPEEKVYVDWLNNLNSMKGRATEIWRETHSYRDALEYYDWLSVSEYAKSLSWDERLAYATDDSLPDDHRRSFLRSLLNVDDPSVWEGGTHLTSDQLHRMVDTLSPDDLYTIFQRAEVGPYYNVDGQPFYQNFLRALSTDQLAEMSSKFTPSDLGWIQHFAPERLNDLETIFPGKQLPELAKISNAMPYYPSLVLNENTELFDPLRQTEGMQVTDLPDNWLQSSMEEWYAKAQKTLPEGWAKDDYLKSIKALMRDAGLSPPPESALDGKISFDTTAFSDKLPNDSQENSDPLTNQPPTNPTNKEYNARTSEVFQKHSDLIWQGVLSGLIDPDKVNIDSAGFLTLSRLTDGRQSGGPGVQHTTLKILEGVADGSINPKNVYKDDRGLLTLTPPYQQQDMARFESNSVIIQQGIDAGLIDPKTVNTDRAGFLSLEPLMNGLQRGGPGQSTTMQIIKGVADGSINPKNVYKDDRGLLTLTPPYQQQDMARFESNSAIIQQGIDAGLIDPKTVNTDRAGFLTLEPLMDDLQRGGRGQSTTLKILEGVADGSINPKNVYKDDRGLLTLTPPQQPSPPANIPKGGSPTNPLITSGYGSASGTGSTIVNTSQGPLSIQLVSEIFGSQGGFIFIPFL